MDEHKLIDYHYADEDVRFWEAILMNSHIFYYKCMQFTNRILLFNLFVFRISRMAKAHHHCYVYIKYSHPLNGWNSLSGMKMVKKWSDGMWSSHSNPFEYCIIYINHGRRYLNWIHIIIMFYRYILRAAVLLNCYSFHKFRIIIQDLWANIVLKWIVRGRYVQLPGSTLLDQVKLKSNGF